MPPPRQDVDVTKVFRFNGVRDFVLNLIAKKLENKQLKLTDVKKSFIQRFRGSEVRTSGCLRRAETANKLLSCEAPITACLPGFLTSGSHYSLTSAPLDFRSSHNQSVGKASILTNYRLEKNIDICYYSDMERHDNNGDYINKLFAFCPEKADKRKLNGCYASWSKTYVKIMRNILPFSEKDKRMSDNQDHYTPYIIREGTISQPKLPSNSERLSESLKRQKKRAKSDDNEIRKKVINDNNRNITTYAHRKQAAFTLAEVLITLAIIGLVAAMTMPSLIQKHREKEYTAKLKKFSSVMSQAILTAISEEGSIENWGLSEYITSAGMDDEELADANASRDKFFKILSKYIKSTEYCSYDSTCETWDRHSLDGNQFSRWNKRMVLADGTLILGATILSPTCETKVGTSKILQNVCGEFMVDVNGKNGPNVTGKDVFIFYYTKYGAIPAGTKEETGYKESKPFDTLCNPKSTHKNNGYGCTAWVIYNGNMDYLHCTDLSWDGKTKCK